jgi:serine/threonine protein phosphatase PrpC
MIFHEYHTIQNMASFDSSSSVTAQRAAAPLDSNITTSLYQSTKGQDFVLWGAPQGQEGSGRKWIVVADGHGRNHTINTIREFNFGSVLDGDDASELIPRLQSKTNVLESGGASAKQRGSGSTISVVEISDAEIKVSWLGDSQVSIWEDGEEIFRTTAHDAETDAAQLGNRGTITSWRTVVTPAMEIENRMSPYVIHGPYDKCNMVRALGHGGQCVNTHDIRSFPRMPGKTYRVVAGSDGLWDMMSDAEEDKNHLRTMNAHELMSLARARWAQEWTYHQPPHVSKQRFEARSWDDIATAVWTSE